MNSDILFNLVLVFIAFLIIQIHRYCINDNLALSNIMGEFYKMPLLCAALSTLIMKLKMSF